MASFADDFRAEAQRRKGEVIRRNAGGWSFCLSYGPVDPKLAADAAEQAKLQMQFAGRDVTDDVLERLRAAGEIQVSEKELTDWLFSARLYPPGRSSTRRDWAYLGSMMAALRIPTTAKILTPFETTDPNATHYWTWNDSPS